MKKWLDASSSSNKYRQMYIKGFLDISGGNLILRNNDLYVLNGDASFGNNLYVSNNATINSTLIVQDLSINGNSNIKFRSNTIPANAIIGGIPASTGIFNVDVSVNGNLYVNSQSTFNDDVTINTRLFVPTIYENGFMLSELYATLESPIFTGGVTFTGDVTGLNSSMVGLGNVNNTSDINKPVSTATTNALSLKANVRDASLVGVPTAPTATAGTNTNQIATTQYVTTGISAIIGSPPSTMNTLQSLALALTNDPSFGIRLTNTLNAGLLSKAPVDSPSFLNYVMAPKLIISSDASFSARLFVSGDVSMNGNVKGNTLFEGGKSLITKYATLAAPTFTGSVVSTGDLSLNSRLYLSGDASFSSRLYVASDVSMNGRLMVSKNSILIGDVSLNNRLFVNGDVSLNSRLYITGNAELGGKLSLVGDLSMGGNLTISQTTNLVGDVSMNNRLFVVGDTSLNGNVMIQKKLIVSSNANFETDVSLNNNVDISGAIIAHNNMNIYGVINQQAVNIYEGYYTTFDTQVVTDVLSIKNIVNINAGGTNTIIGNSASVTSGTNTTVLGNNARPSSSNASNEITLGNSSINVLRCAATTITAISDERDKTNIEELPVGLDFIKELKPVKFDWAMRDGGKIGTPDFGFIAQDLLAAQSKVGTMVPNLVNAENPDRLEASYAKLLPILVKAIQELQETVIGLKSELETLSKK